MTVYRVELHGEARELFEVEAESPEEAATLWEQGESYLKECTSTEIYSVEEEM